MSFYMKHLYRKTYYLEIKIPRKILKDKEILFKYKQGTINQLLELSNWIGKQYDVRGYILHFLNDICFEGKISSKDFRKIKFRHTTKIFNYIMNTLGKDYFNQEKSKDSNNIPTSSFIASICKQLKMSALDFLQLTWEQVSYLSDGIVWNNNEMTKEGKRENIRNSMKNRTKTPATDEEIAELRRIDAKINALK